MTSDALMEGAIAAHRRRCRRHGLIYQQPSEACSKVRRGVVILRNSYAELGHYQWNEGCGRFEYVEDA